MGHLNFSLKGVDLFGVKDQIDLDDNVLWHSTSASPHFEQYMTFNRFKDFRRFLPAVFADPTKVETDPWYQLSTAIDNFNEIRRLRVSCSRWLVADESMSAWRPRTTALGGLPNISFVIRKPEPLGKT